MSKYYKKMKEKQFRRLQLLRYKALANTITPEEKEELEALPKYCKKSKRIKNDKTL